MEYNIRYQKGGLLLLIILGGIVLFIGGGIALAIALDNDAIAPICAVVGIFVPLFVGLKVSYFNTHVKIADKVITVNKQEIPFAEIQSYYLRMLTPKVSVIDISLMDGKEVSVTGLNYGKPGEQMNKMLADMQALFNTQLNLKQVESAGSMKIRLYRRRWKKFIMGLVIFTGLTDVFIVLMYFTGVAHSLNIFGLLAINLTIPSLLVFRSQIDDDGGFKKK